MRCRPAHEDVVRSLATDQLIRLITRGQWVELCEAEWQCRWGRPYPWRRTATGWKREGD